MLFKKIYDLLPRKSIFGFKILSSWDSIFSSYILLILFYFLAPKFGKEEIQIIAENLFLIILNFSLLILTFNSIIQKNKKPKILWTITSLPLWIFLPIEIKIILYATKNMLALN
tara:strand:- start:6874 stop:7215 length:342 start_codon:yes stop_codon:yes gene_type:complete